jgi:riboflavin biosynthesis pyrimidine reductase
LPVEAGEDGFAPARILALLADRGALRVLVEGGGVTVSRFLAAGALDVLHVAIAPMLIGSGRQGISLPPIDRLDQALRPSVRRVPLGEDMLYALSFR